MDKKKIAKVTAGVACGLVVTYVGYQTYQFIKDERKRKAVKEIDSKNETSVYEDDIKEDVDGTHGLDKVVVKELYDKAFKTVCDKTLRYLIADMHSNPDKYPDVDLTDEVSVYEQALYLFNEFSAEFIEDVSKEHYRLMTKDL